MKLNSVMYHIWKGMGSMHFSWINTWSDTRNLRWVCQISRDGVIKKISLILKLFLKKSFGEYLHRKDYS